MNELMPSDFGAPLRWLWAVPARRWTAIIAGWSLIGFLSAAHWQLFFQGESPYTWWQLLRIKILLWYLWGGCTLWILWICARYRPEGNHGWARVLALFGWSVVVVSIYLAVYAVAIWAHLHWIGKPAQFMPMVQFVLANHSTYYYLAFWATVGIEYAYEYARRSRSQDLRVSQLAAQLSEARLRALEARLQPHFLFNALNTIASMVTKHKAEEAYDVLVRLSELLRESLKKSEQQSVTLARELEFTRHYLEIVKARFPDSVSYRVALPDELASLAVPALILQPLVENAVIHGLEPASSLEIEIDCRRENGCLLLGIHDNGPGLPDAFDLATQNGFGLQSTRTRLSSLFGERADFQLQPRHPRGVCAQVRLPISGLESSRSA